MADMNSTATQTKPRRRTAPGGLASAPAPAYGAGAGVLSFRHGLGVRECDTIDRALAIVGRCLREPGAVLGDPATVTEYIRLHIGGEGREVFCVLYLDVQSRFLAFDRMFIGTLNQTSVYPREVVTAALRYGAHSVILAHNHPSGSVQPSVADQMLTQTLKSALSLVDVRVLDHVIVSGKKSLSMAMHGLM